MKNAQSSELILELYIEANSLEQVELDLKGRRDKFR